MARKHKTIEELYVAIKADYDQLKQDFKSVKNLARKEGKDSGKSFGKGFEAALQKGAILLIIKKILDLGKAAVMTSANMEMLKVRLGNLYGSAERGIEVFKKLEHIASTTPFEVTAMVEAGAQLKAFGLDAERTAKMTADLAAFMGTDVVEAANSLGRAFAGGAGAADIFREKGILNLIKMKSGITDLNKLTLPEFRQVMLTVFSDAASGVEGSTDTMAKTFTGALSNMWDSITQLSAGIGDMLVPIIKPIIKVVSYLAQIGTEGAKGLKSMFDSMVDGKSITESFTIAVNESNERLKNSGESAEESKRKLDAYIKSLNDATTKGGKALPTTPVITDFKERYYSEQDTEGIEQYRAQEDARYTYSKDADGRIIKSRKRLYDNIKMLAEDEAITLPKIQNSMIQNLNDVWEAGVDSFFASGLMTIWQEFTAGLRKDANLATKIVLQMVDQMMAALARLMAQLAIMAILKAAATAQHGYSGVAPKRMQSGGAFTVPHGFQNDQYPLLVDSGERVQVTTRAGVNSQDSLLRGIGGKLDAMNANMVAQQGSNLSVQITGETHIKKGDIYKSYEKQAQLNERYG